MWRRLALLATATGACGGHPAPAAHALPVRADAAVTAPGLPLLDAPPRVPLDQDLPRLVTRAVAQVQAVAAALTAAGDDCAAATAKLTEIERGYADVIAANASVAASDRKDELAAAMVPQQAALDAAAAAVFRSHTIAACAQQPAFAAALDGALGAGGGP